MSKYRNLFLQQSYRDSYDEYEKSLKKSNYPVWDYVILTASNEMQASFYRMQIERRLKNNKLPSSTHYAVVADPDGQRVGSGGATLCVLKYIAEHRGSTNFNGVKILCIHSGGDSKRVPQYSACGKLFSPVPRRLSDGRRSTLFDEFIISMTGVPARMTDGMLVCSGDVLLLFNPLQLDFYGKGAAALSIKEPVSLGKDHGVFLGDEFGNVKNFLHKQSVQKLTESGAVDVNGKVNIDTGAVILDGNILNDIFGLVTTEEKFNFYVNSHVRLSFYADFLYPLAGNSTLDAYLKETPEGEFSSELETCRKAIWEVLRKYKMKLLRFSPASFIHFGTTAELLSLMTDKMGEFKYLDWSGNVNTNNKDDSYSCSNAFVSANAKIGKGSYIEDSYIKNCVVGNGCVISGVTLNNVTVPDGTVLHGLKLRDGKFIVRSYGVNDNPKENKWFGNEIAESLWQAKLFVPCDTMEEAVNSTLNKVSSSNALSLCDSFNLADTSAIIGWEDRLQDYVMIESFLHAIELKKPLTDVEIEFKNVVSARVIDSLIKTADELMVDSLESFGCKIRIYYYLTKFVGEELKEQLYLKSFESIRNALMAESKNEIKYKPFAKIKKDNVITRLPVRVNFGGGWSDTPPYCNEHGGTVLNAAIKINGEYPIEAKISKIPGWKIALASEDNDSYREFSSVKELQSCGEPGDPFALHKAALIVCGIIPENQEVTLEEITKRLGGGFCMSTQAIGIPRGSGLGTSSILAGACVKAIYEFIGQDITLDSVYNHVICMEQLMSTGGGWQDQVGGLTKGFKIISSDPGIKQQICCKSLDFDSKTLNELNERFAIIYTGQRRLARNLLREIVGKYVSSSVTTVTVLDEIQKLARLMCSALTEGDIDRFAGILNQHWELSKTLDKGCTNTCIDQIFNSIDDLIDGKMICGAGGGGFLQVVMKKGVTKKDLKDRLDEIFAGSGVDVWSCEFD